MSLKILKKIVERNPLEYERVILVLDNKPLTTREVIEIVERGGPLAKRVLEELRKIGIDPPTIPEEWWKIVYERYKQKPKDFGIWFRGKLWYRDDILREIEKRTEIGEIFVRMEMEYLQELMK